MKFATKNIVEFASERNSSKLLFSAGPASLLPENILGLIPCFGRGDKQYARVEKQVLKNLMSMSGHKNIACMQGSASLALEVMALNFLYGRVLVISTGYYSERLISFARMCMQNGSSVREVVCIEYQNLHDIVGNFDWVLSCSTETSRGIRIPIHRLAELSKRLHAKLMIDATASIGLEADHDLVDVLAFSSCKGLFGLTGAAFVAFNESPTQEVNSFYLRMATHTEKLITGPYHAICSLANVLPRHADFYAAVYTNKQRFMSNMKTWLTVPPDLQPLLCTHVKCKLTSSHPGVVLYQPRGNLRGSIVCHLGEVHLGRDAKGDIQKVLSIAERMEN